MRNAFAVATGVGIALLASSAQSRPERVLHEYVAPPGEVPSAPLQPGVLPPAIRTEDRLLPQPESSAAANPGERLRGEGMRPDRTTSLQLDRSTQREGVLHYTAEFNPEVVPFKRMTSFDRVDSGYRLLVRDPSLRAEPLAAGPTPPDRDAFWASLLLSLRAGVPVPIPSVAPEARILSYRSTPSGARFSFFRDSADNFWVKADTGGRFRLVFLTDAPRHYFSPQIPPTVTVADVPARLRPSLPADVKRAAAAMLRRLELAPGGNTFLRQLDRLVAYFRAFEAGELPRGSGDTYLDISLNQRGVCRHRSFAFVVTAQALGIPARYVQNEAHAFSEVFVPRLGWVRINLGGASDELRVQNGQDKAIHDPGPDPFPKPARYASGGERGTGMSISGIQPGRRLRRRNMGVSLRAYDHSAGGAAASGAESSRAGRTAPGAARRTVSGSGDETGDDASADAGDQRSSKRATEIVLFSPTRIVYRGEQIQVWGRVASEGTGVAGLPVEIYLSRDGKTGEVLLGTLVSGPEGRFRTSLPVPLSVAVGDYQVFAATAGDARHDSSLSH